MHVVIQQIDHADRPLLALSFVLFAGAGASNTTLEDGVHSAVAVALVVAGCYCLARYARLISRKRLATVSLALWIAFLAVSTFHVIGLSTVAAVVPVSAGVTATMLDAVTWSALLSAAVSTVFLGFREYGSGTVTDSPDELIDGDVEY